MQFAQRPRRQVADRATLVKCMKVKVGDNLSNISKQFYDAPNEYMRIFYANRDKVSDPDRIQVGQKLSDSY